MSVVRRFLPVFLLAAGVSVVLWSQGPSYTSVFTGLSDRDASEIVTAIEAAGAGSSGPAPRISRPLRSVPRRVPGS